MQKNLHIYLLTQSSRRGCYSAVIRCNSDVIRCSKIVIAQSCIWPAASLKQFHRQILLGDDMAIYYIYAIISYRGQAEVLFHMLYLGLYGMCYLLMLPMHLTLNNCHLLACDLSILDSFYHWWYSPFKMMNFALFVSLHLLHFLEQLQVRHTWIMSEDKLPESEQKTWVQFDEDGGGTRETPTNEDAPATIDVQNETSESPGDTSNIRVSHMI